eukprot:m.134735 g.134735  ORF g.134735 m.134735 type:complete len:961 (-) comp29756_c0_seq1:58-2940(-)
MDRTHGSINGSARESDPLLAKKMSSGRLTAINDDEEVKDEPTKNQLGALNGVYIPCLLNILGAVLFMRIGYSVGYAGWLGTVLIFVFSETVTILTALSFSAIVTNGKMAGGGAYYMISRSIGPAFGGATGIMFYWCYVANAAFNGIAFVEDILQTFFPHLDSHEYYLYTLYFYHSTLFVLLLVAMGGAGAFAKVNIFLFTVLITSIVITIGTLIFSTHLKDLGNMTAIGPDSCYAEDPDEPKIPVHVVYYPPSTERFKTNFWWPDNVTDPNIVNNLVAVLAIIFTSTCGVMEGANLSGDLKNPSKALPKGTLFAKCTSFSTYILFTTILALCFDRRALQCQYLVLQEAAPSKYIVVAGIAMATLSTSLGAMFGAARILQAIARDDLFPLSFFKKGDKRGDEPRRAVFLTYLLANGFVYLGSSSLNTLGGVLTDFFLTAYAFVNLSQFLLSISNAPNYRPTFNYTRWYISLFAFVLSMSLMWYLNRLYAGITCGTWVLIFCYVKLTAVEKDWGDVSQAILFRTLVSWLKDLIPRKDNVKFWRSNVLLLVQDTDLPLLSFCKHLTKDGLFIIGSALPDIKSTPPSQADNLSIKRGRQRSITQESMLPRFTNPVSLSKSVWLWVVESANLNAMVQVGAGARLLGIYRTMISCAGLGGLVPNTVALPFRECNDDFSSLESSYASRINRQLASYEGRKISKNELNNILWNPETYNSGLGFAPSTPGHVDYVNLLKTIIELEKNVMILRNIGEMEEIFKDKKAWLANFRNGKISVGSLNEVNPLPEQINMSGTKTRRRYAYIDVWIVGEWDWDSLEENITIMLQHAHLMKEAMGKGVKLRIIQLVRYFFSEEQVRLHQGLVDLVEAARISMPELVVYPAPQSTVGSPVHRANASEPVNNFEGLNRTIKSHSSDTVLAFLALPNLPQDVTENSASTFIRSLDSLTNGLPPLALIKKGEPASILSTRI